MPKPTKYKHEYRMHTVYCDDPVKYHAFYQRIRNWMPIEQAIKTWRNRLEIMKHFKKHQKLHGDDWVTYMIFRNRLHAHNRSLERAINTPNTWRGGNRRKTKYKAERQELFEWLHKHYSYCMYRKRRKTGMSEKEAIEKY